MNKSLLLSTLNKLEESVTAFLEDTRLQEATTATIEKVLRSKGLETTFADVLAPYVKLLAGSRPTQADFPDQIRDENGKPFTSREAFMADLERIMNYDTINSPFHKDLGMLTDMLVSIQNAQSSPQEAAAKIERLQDLSDPTDLRAIRSILQYSSAA